MDRKGEIDNLLKKFRNGDITPSEAKELSLLIKEGDNNKLLKEILTNDWQQAANSNSDIPSEKMFQKVKQELHFTEKRKGYRIITNIIKYAAIIIVTIGITLLFNQYISDKSTGYVENTKVEGNNIITISYGSKSKITLPDGSNVSLNSGSILRYPSKFSSTDRNVYVEGEAFFDVKKDPKHPFFVKTRALTIKVLGTKFNVKAYNDEKTIQTTLVSGSIEIYPNKKGVSEKDKIVALKENQQVTFDTNSEDLKLIDSPKRLKVKTEKLIKPVVSDKIDVAPIIAWKDNRLEFRDEKFSDLSRRLERWYNVEIIMKDTELKTVLFSGVFEKETIEQALDALKLATLFRYRMKKNQITIYK